MSSNLTILSARDVSVSFATKAGRVEAVKAVSFDVCERSTIGLVGESGCGKSVLSLSLLRLLPSAAEISGTVAIIEEGATTDLFALREQSAELQRIRGGEIAMIFQEPVRALFPMRTIGAQMLESIEAHVTTDRAEATSLAVEMLDRVGLARPKSLLRRYPHEMSGGMCQRIMIASALCSRPRLLVADEPTTALDVTVQAQVLDLLLSLQSEFDMSTLFISHDLAVVGEISDSVMVMYLGRFVERAPVRRIFENAAHPYTRGLIQAMPGYGPSSRQRLSTIDGTVPLPIGLGSRCGFYGRCTHAIEGTCDRAVPPEIEIERDHFVRCHLYGTSVSNNE